MKKNKNRGITLASLVITIIVLLIIAGISVYSGTDIIKRAKLEELKTNMLQISIKDQNGSESSHNPKALINNKKQHKKKQK